MIISAILNKILSHSNKLTLFTLRATLRIHSFTYGFTSYLSHKVEKGRLHPKHRIINYHKFFVDNITNKDNILDIGCGNGELTYDIAKKAKRVVAIDLKKKNIKTAKAQFLLENIEYIHGDATINLPNEQFDIVILSNVLEHIDKRIEFLEKLKRQTSQFLIRIPMSNGNWINIYKRELGLKYLLDESHFTEYTLESFKKEIKEAGLIIYDYSIQFSEIWAIVRV